MNKLIISLFFYLCLLSGNSQTYIPMIEDSLIIVNEYNGVINPFYNKYKILGDTLISGKTYFKCFSDLNLKDSSFSVTTNMSYYGAIRENNKKIFFINKNSTSEKKIYDFSLNVGDTTQFYFHDYFVNQYEDVVLRTFGTTPYFFGRNIYTFSSNLALLGQIITAEGFGNIIYETNEIDTIAPSKRVCIIKKNNSAHNIPSSYSQCYQNILDSYVSLNEKNNTNNFTVFPNPAKQYFQLSSDNTKLSSLVIFDIRGEKIKEFQMNSNTKRIDVAHLESGVYILKITVQDGEVISKKLIKD